MENHLVKYIEVHCRAHKHLIQPDGTFLYSVGGKTITSKHATFVLFAEGNIHDEKEVKRAIECFDTSFGEIEYLKQDDFVINLNKKDNKDDGWIRTSDRTPKYDTQVLVLLGASFVISELRNDDEFGVCWNLGDEYLNLDIVKYWRELPNLPKY